MSKKGVRQFGRALFDKLTMCNTFSPKKFNRYVVCTAFFVIGVLGHTGCLAVGQPYTPMNDNEVLETLPRNYLQISPAANSDRNPEALDLSTVAKQIRAYLSLASDTGDERYLGYADALISRLNETALQTTDILMSRAALLQRRHQFEEALDLLQQVTTRYPQHGEAHLMSAYIYLAQGKADAAEKHCSQVLSQYGGVAGLSCLASAKSLQGDLETYYQMLKKVLRTRSVSPVEQQDGLLSLAEIARMRGEFAVAEEYYRAALQLNSNDSFLLMRLADLYLTQGNYRNCITLLQDHQQHANLLLRLAIAQQGLQQQVDPSIAKQLQRYFELQLLRNPKLATRDYAEYLLHIQQDPVGALTVAQTNWQSQREVADTELVVRAAIAAGKVKRITPVIDWIRESGMQDSRIRMQLAGVSVSL